MKNFTFALRAPGYGLIVGDSWQLDQSTDVFGQRWTATWVDGDRTLCLDVRDNGEIKAYVHHADDGVCTPAVLTLTPNKEIEETLEG